MDFSALIKELGIDKLPQDQQQAMFEDIFKTLQLRMSLRLSEVLTEDQRKELEDAAAKGEEEGLAALDRICPDYGKMYQEEIDLLKDDMKL